MKLTWQELERLVAERLEPKPDLKAAWSLGGLSALGFWQLHSKAGVLPVQFRTDEAANARLRRHLKLQLMIGHYYVKGVLQNERLYYFCGPRNELSARALDIRVMAHHEDDKTAIILAAKAFLKIEGDVE